MSDQELNRTYPDDFPAGDNYKATMPDLQNSDGFKGAKVELPIVGIHNFKMPIQFTTADGESISLMTAITGAVSLQAENKGINMSRIIRSFYATEALGEHRYALDLADRVLDVYAEDLGVLDTRITLAFAYPMLLPSLRSGLSGWQYYDMAVESQLVRGKRIHIIHLDYVYSSTCPCSLELAEHARRTRNQMATPHSQRSVARVSVELAADLEPPGILFEDLIEACQQAIPTETQVMVKREDEQAFAELNGCNPIFVEDATRLLYHYISQISGIESFRIICSHQESLHSHDAIAMTTRGDLFSIDSLDPNLFRTLIKER